jgi:hypothetical protein
VVERTTRFTILLHLPGWHTAEQVRDALIAALSPLLAQLRRSLTADQGNEMALHHEIAGVPSMPVFFSQKSSPWQRPSWRMRSIAASHSSPNSLGDVLAALGVLLVAAALAGPVVSTCSWS